MSKKLLKGLLGAVLASVAIGGMSVTAMADSSYEEHPDTECEGANYMYDEYDYTSHYKVCSVCDKAFVESHAGVVHRYYDDDNHTNECAVCGNLYTPIGRETAHTYIGNTCRQCGWENPNIKVERKKSEESKTESKSDEEIAEQREQERQKAWEDAITIEKETPVTTFTSPNLLYGMPQEIKNAGASYNVSWMTTTQGFASAVEKIAANAKAQNNGNTTSVTIYSSKPMVFDNNILDAVSDADLDFSYTFIHNGKFYKITIPRGTKVDLGGKKYEGPLYIGKLLGTTQELK